MRISMIAAIASENRAIGKNNRLIYHIPQDLKRFKEITSGHPIIMGRKTFESIGVPLPNRRNIVITRDEDYFAEGVSVTHSLEEALGLVQNEEEVFIIGGGEIYKQAIGIANKLYLTVIEDNPDADVFFPDYSNFKKVVFEESHEYNGLKYKFLDLEKP
ncbi:dihydrofolate reductase [Candidatus Daviesbacteria bacterium]|nr:dihydrofolate reductase [Candidatus Daviesbacteria bacterium]